MNRRFIEDEIVLIKLCYVNKTNMTYTHVWIYTDAITKYLSPTVVEIMKYCRFLALALSYFKEKRYINIYYYYYYTSCNFITPHNSDT